MIDPKEYFTASNFEDYYQKKLKFKKGGGIDNLTAATFYRLYHDRFEEMAGKCMDGSYRFSCYREMLAIKKRNKLPRVLSIPAMKDRLILGVMNEYLQAVYMEKGYRQSIPNENIQAIHKFLLATPGPVRFLKTDFSNYYGNIRHRLLLKKLAPDIDPSILKLVKTAIKTPTIPKGKKSSDAKPAKKGVPQGLPISNILAYIYMKDFDDNHACDMAGLYIRYVDDMLFLSPKNPEPFEKVKETLDELGLKVHFSKAKLQEGIVGVDKLKFIGYSIGKDKISIPKNSISRFITHIAGLTSKCKAYKDPAKRPSNIQTDEQYFKYFIEQFNLKISGFKMGNHRYGWLSYYQSVSDISQFYGIDRVIRNRIMKDVPLDIKDNVFTLTDSYFDLRSTGGRKCFRDFDEIYEITDKKEYLVNMGYDITDTTDEDVEWKFRRLISNLIKESELSIGRIS